MIKLHHSEAKEWSSLSHSGWNDFISCLVAWWMMKWWNAGLKNKSEQTKQQTRLEYPKDSHWRRKKEIDILSTLFVCFAVNLLRICLHILIEGKLYMTVSSIAPQKLYVEIKYLYWFCPCFGICNNTMFGGVHNLFPCC